MKTICGACGQEIKPPDDERRVERGMWAVRLIVFGLFLGLAIIGSYR
ncbi:MAG: hypothetical protein V4773_16655 [Verrucomicrobiota bacterium]